MKRSESLLPTEMDTFFPFKSTRFDENRGKDNRTELIKKKTRVFGSLLRSYLD